MAQPNAADKYPTVMPGTSTAAPSPEHDKATAQGYTLDDGGSKANPVTLGTHVREKFTAGPNAGA